MRLFTLKAFFITQVKNFVCSGYTKHTHHPPCRSRHHLLQLSMGQKNDRNTTFFKQKAVRGTRFISETVCQDVENYLGFNYLFQLCYTKGSFSIWFQHLDFLLPLFTWSLISSLLDLLPYMCYWVAQS